MSNPNGHRADSSRLRYLIEAYCNQVADDEEFAELEQRLLEDRGARDEFLRYMNLEVALENLRDEPADPWVASVLRPSARVQSGTWNRQLIAVAVTSAVAIVALLVGIRWEEPFSEPHPPVVGILDRMSGPVIVAGADGEVRQAQSGSTIRAGDTVRTKEPASTATVAYPDGTRLSLIGETSITVHGHVPKATTVHGGTLFASVTAQPNSHPMRIVTLTDRLEILGTKFALDATSGETDLRVREGRVRLTRLVDGESVVVPAGQRVVSHARSELALENIPPTPSEWAVDLANGLPADWGAGKIVAADVAAGTGMAVRAVGTSGEQNGPFEIATANRWMHGLFAIHDDSHLQFTFRTERPGWFNILILTRTSEGEPPTFSGNYIFDEPGWRSLQAGRWITATIPLRAFRPLPPSRASFADVVPFQVLFSAPKGDCGLMIRSIRVTRGGPGRVQTKEVTE